MKAHIKSNPHSSNFNYHNQNTQLIEYKMPLKTIKIITFQILRGLSYLHHQGVMHRNLKSDNIVINKNLEVKICDFALSRLATTPHILYTPEVINSIH